MFEQSMYLCFSYGNQQLIFTHSIYGWKIWIKKHKFNALF